MLSIIMLRITMLRITMLNVTMLNVVILNVVSWVSLCWVSFSECRAAHFSLSNNDKMSIGVWFQTSILPLGVQCHTDYATAACPVLHQIGIKFCEGWKFWNFAENFVDLIKFPMKWKEFNQDVNFSFPGTEEREKNKDLRWKNSHQFDRFLRL